MGRPGDEARMAKMRARQAPFTDAREGRLKRQVRTAFRLYGGKPLTPAGRRGLVEAFGLSL
jgi:hypothetical protein